MSSGKDEYALIGKLFTVNTLRGMHKKWDADSLKKLMKQSVSFKYDNGLSSILYKLSTYLSQNPIYNICKLFGLICITCYVIHFEHEYMLSRDNLKRVGLLYGILSGFYKFSHIFSILSVGFSYINVNMPDITVYLNKEEKYSFYIGVIFKFILLLLIEILYFISHLFVCYSCLVKTDIFKELFEKSEKSERNLILATFFLIVSIWKSI